MHAIVTIPWLLFLTTFKKILTYISDYLVPSKDFWCWWYGSDNTKVRFTCITLPNFTVVSTYILDQEICLCFIIYKFKYKLRTSCVKSPPPITHTRIGPRSAVGRRWTRNVWGKYHGHACGTHALGGSYPLLSWTNGEFRKYCKG